ncbi:MAG TPA: VOC family protein, partial [Chloroflexota bacterium]
MAHPIVHIEIPAADPKKSGAFYADVFGWQVQTDPQFDYTMFQADGGPGGAFPKIGANADAVPYEAGRVLVYIGSDDIDADLRQVEEHGGQIVMAKNEIPSVGWWA